MIASLQGHITQIREDGLVVVVGGVGIFVVCSPAVVAEARVGEVITLATSLVVREDSLTLFGFQTIDSRDLFEVIQAVNGFGPKLAFTLLSFLPAEALRQAIATENVAVLTKTPGVGAKGAARLVLELKDKVGPAAGSGSNVAAATTGATSDTVAQALVGLGWSKAQALAAVDEVLSSQPDAATPDVLRRALQRLGQA